MKASWSNMPKGTGGGYGVPEDMEVFIDETLKDNRQLAILVTLHEVAELSLPITNHCQLDIMARNMVSCLKQLGLLGTT